MDRKLLLVQVSTKNCKRRKSRPETEEEKSETETELYEKARPMSARDVVRLNIKFYASPLTCFGKLFYIFSSACFVFFLWLCALGCGDALIALEMMSLFDGTTK